MGKSKDVAPEENAAVSEGKPEKAEKPAKPAKAEKVQKAQKKDKNKKPNIFVRMGRKLKETFSELKRVTWPTFGTALKSTGVVLVIVLAFTIVMTGVNVGFTELLQLITSWGA